MVYVGPYYNNGIIIEGQSYKPRDMSDDEREDFLEKYPERSVWWHNDDLSKLSISDELDDAKDDTDTEDE